MYCHLKNTGSPVLMIHNTRYSLTNITTQIEHPPAPTLFNDHQCLS